MLFHIVELTLQFYLQSSQHFVIFFFSNRYHAAHLTNDGPTEDLAREVGKVSGDMTFPLVYTPELHFCEFESAVADMKNSVKVYIKGRPYMTSDGSRHGDQH